MSFSGRERNQFLASAGGKGFVNLSYLSGADTDLDGRVAARADLDHDGDEDLIVVSRNRPLLTIYSNESESKDFLVVRVEPQPIGTTVWATCGTRTIRRDVFGGEGFGTQSSRTLTVGLGECPVVDRLRVRYPSGAEEAYEHLPSRRAYRVARGEKPTVVDGYVRTARASRAAAASATLNASWLPDAPYVYVTLWASWCTACQNAQPRLEALGREVKILALSVEPTDGADAVEAYRQRYHPEFDLGAYDESRVRDIEHVLGVDPPLPSGFLVERVSGRVVWSGVGVATRSDVARAVHMQKPGGLNPFSLPIVVAAAVVLLALVMWRRSSRPPT